MSIYRVIHLVLVAALCLIAAPAQAGPWLPGVYSVSSGVSSTDGLILLYAPSQGTETCVPTGGPNTCLTDRSGNGNHAQFSGTPTWTTDHDGTSNSAVSFVTGTFDRTTTAHSALFNVGNDGLTVCTWWKGAGSVAPVFAKWGNTDGEGWQLVVSTNGTLSFNSGNSHFDSGTTLESPQYTLSTYASTVPLNTWTMICSVRDHPGLHRFYVDGVMSLPSTMASTNLSRSGDLTNSSPFEMGSQSCVQTPCNQGNGFRTYATQTLGKTWVYNRALRTSEIQALYTGGAWPSESRYATRCDSLRATYGTATSPQGTGLLWCNDFNEPEDAIMPGSGGTLRMVGGLPTVVTAPTTLWNGSVTADGSGGGALHWHFKSFEGVRSAFPSLTRPEAYDIAKNAYQATLLPQWLGDKKGNIWHVAGANSNYVAFGNGEEYWLQFRMKMDRPWFSRSASKIGFGFVGGCRKYNGEYFPPTCWLGAGGADSMETLTQVMAVPLEGPNSGYPADYAFPPVDANQEQGLFPDLYSGSTNWQRSFGESALMGSNSNYLYGPGYSYTRGYYNGTEWVGGCSEVEIKASKGGAAARALTQCKPFWAPDVWHEVTVHVKASGQWTPSRHNLDLRAGSVSAASAGVISNVHDTLFTAARHELKTGDSVTITGATGLTAINGTWPVTVLSPTTFSIPVNTLAGGYTANSASMHFAGPHSHTSKARVYLDGVNIINRDIDSRMPPFRVGQPTPADCATKYVNSVSVHQSAGIGGPTYAYNDCHTGRMFWRAGNNWATTGNVTQSSAVVTGIPIDTATMRVGDLVWLLRPNTYPDNAGAPRTIVSIDSSSQITVNVAWPYTSLNGARLIGPRVAEGQLAPVGVGDAGADLSIAWIRAETYRRGNVHASWAFDNCYQASTTGNLTGGDTKIRNLASLTGFVVGQKVIANGNPTALNNLTYYVWVTNGLESATISAIEPGACAGGGTNCLTLSDGATVYSGVSNGSYTVRTGGNGFAVCMASADSQSNSYEIGSFTNHPDTNLYLDNMALFVGTAPPMINGQYAKLPYECNGQETVSTTGNLQAASATIVSVASFTNINVGDTLVYESTNGAAGFADGMHFATITAKNSGAGTITLDRQTHAANTGATLRVGGASYRACMAPAP